MTTRRNIIIEQGTYFEYSIDMNNEDSTPFDLSLYTVKSEFRKHFESANSIEFTTIKASGKLTLILNASVSANCDPGRYEYDVFLYPNGNANQASKILEGLLTIKSSATKI